MEMGVVRKETTTFYVILNLTIGKYDIGHHVLKVVDDNKWYLTCDIILCANLLTRLICTTR